MNRGQATIPRIHRATDAPTTNSYKQGPSSCVYTAVTDSGWHGLCSIHSTLVRKMSDGSESRGVWVIFLKYFATELQEKLYVLVTGMGAILLGGLAAVSKEFSIALL